MSEGLRTPASYPDREEGWEAEHYRRRCRDVIGLVSEEIVAEHRANPFGYRDHHSLGLQKVDRLLKTYPAGGARHTPVLEGSEWRLIELRRDRQPVVLDAPVFETLEEAVHDLFLRRLAALRATAEGKES